MKPLLAINRGAMENWKTFSRNWMNHRNPYTGLTWGEDPALACLNLVNEDPLSSVWNRTPETTAIYRRKFQEWKKANNAEESDFLRFLQETQSRVLDEQIDFAKNELKLKTMITGLNMLASAPLTVLRDKFDLVDNHQYFSHPAFPEKAWRPPPPLRPGVRDHAQCDPAAADDAGPDLREAVHPDRIQLLQSERVPGRERSADRRRSRASELGRPLAVRLEPR
jgi:hypothetical protein